MAGKNKWRYSYYIVTLEFQNVLQDFNADVFSNFRRLFTAMAGWKAGPFAAFDYFFWIPWLVPHFGGIVGAVIYELMVELHHPEPEETQEFYITK